MTGKYLIRLFHFIFVSIKILIYVFSMVYIKSFYSIFLKVRTLQGKVVVERKEKFEKRDSKRKIYVSLEKIETVYIIFRKLFWEKKKKVIEFSNPPVVSENS